MKGFRDDIRERAAAVGRNPDHIKVLFCITPTLGETDDEAHEKYRRMLNSSKFIEDILVSISTITDIDFAKFDLDKPLPEKLVTNGEQGSLDKFQQYGSGNTLRQLVIDGGGRSWRWFAILTIGVAAGAVKHGIPPKLGFNLVAFGVQFGACASYQIAYAPYVSDYSRYLPRETKASSIIRAVFIGASAAAIWLIALGAWLATRLAASDPLVAINQSGNTLFHGFGTIDNYSGMLTLATTLDSIKRIQSTKLLGPVLVLAFTALWVAVTLVGGQNAINALTLALTIILYLLVPWTAVNLVDFWIARASGSS
jgi:hypothetical protein